MKKPGDNQRTGCVVHTVLTLLREKLALAMAELALQKTALEYKTTHHIAACQGNQKETLTEGLLHQFNQVEQQTDRPGCTGAWYHFAADKSQDHVFWI